MLHNVETFFSIAAILVVVRTLLHPDHVTQRSCASAVSLLFSTLERPMERDIGVQVSTRVPWNMCRGSTKHLFAAGQRSMLCRRRNVCP